MDNLFSKMFKSSESTIPEESQNPVEDSNSFDSEQQEVQLEKQKEIAQLEGYITQLQQVKNEYEDILLQKVECILNEFSGGIKAKIVSPEAQLLTQKYSGLLAVHGGILGKESFLQEIASMNIPEVSKAYQIELFDQIESLKKDLEKSLHGKAFNLMNSEKINQEVYPYFLIGDGRYRFSKDLANKTFTLQELLSHEIQNRELELKNLKN